MNKLKDKIINIFYEEDVEEDVVVEISLKVLKKRIILASSIVLNFIFNILYISFFCYSKDTSRIGFLIFIISLIWTIISLINSYKLYSKWNFLFYLNLLVILFESKLWFVII